MSYKDITKVLDLQSDDLSSSEVLLLIAMARRANPQNNNLTYSSIGRLVSETRLNRKTILSSRKKLLDKNFILETNQKTGFTKQIPVFQLTSKLLDIINNPKNGSVPKRNQTKNGTLTEEKDPNIGTPKDPNFGTGKDPNIGTLNSNRNNNNEYVCSVVSEKRPLGGETGEQHIQKLKSLLRAGEPSETPTQEQQEQIFKKNNFEKSDLNPPTENNLEPTQTTEELLAEVDEYFNMYPKGN